MSPSSAWANGLGLAFGIAAASALVVGCETSTSEVGYGYAGGSSSSGGGSSSSSSGAGTKPMLVVVDADRTMNATPGDGVGVFIEYRTGGHWRVWWTCDTNKTAQSCDFDVTVSVASGAISNPASIGNASLLPSGPGTSAGAVEAEAQATTTSSTDGMSFDASAGATITLDAKMDGQEDGSFLFFVQDGKINGGYAGTLTDPLMLQPSAP